MSKDISIIREELATCEEVILPFTFSPGSWIKYITIKDEDEVFYTGGEYSGMGNHKIYLTNKSKKWAVPTCYRDDDGTTLYKSRFFIDVQKTKQESKDEKEDMKIIKSQQKIIDKLTTKLKDLENINHEFQCEIYDIRSENETFDNQIKELMIREKKYKLILQHHNLLKT